MKKKISNLLHTTLSLKDRGTLSVSALQKNLLHSSKQKRRFDDKLHDKLPLTTINSTEFKIISPFYDRNKVCKTSNCHCPFHKRLREEASKKFHMRSKKVFKSTIHSPKKVEENGEKDQHERLSHQVHPKNKENNSPQRGDRESKTVHRNKINSFNVEFDQFIKLANQVLLNKINYAKINDHIIKRSVGEIFKYIYENLDKERNEVEEHIQGIEKDRDITNFYLDRFEDLKRRRTAKQIDKKKTRITTSKEANQSLSRATSKAATRNFQRNPTVARKTNKEKTQKVILMEKLIKYVKDGNEVDEEEVNEIAVLNMEHFEENCNLLKKKIGTFDLDMLESVKEDIVQQLQRKLIQSDSDNKTNPEDQEKKKEIVQSLLASITKRIEQLDKDDESDYQREIYDRVGSSYRKTSLTRKGSNDCQGSKRNSKFMDMNRKTIFISENIDNPNTQDKQESLGSLSSTNRDNTLGTINSPRNFQPEQLQDKDAQFSDLPQALKKNKLKLAKYRRLSHEGFFQKRLSDDENGFFIPKIHIQRMEDIGPRLDALALQFGEKWKKIKEIQRRISDMKMKKYIIFENDSLITAKRKIHMLKEMLKGQVFDGHLKEEIKEYINLVEQFNILKNRTWAERKLKNMIKFNDDEISISDANEEANENTFHRLIEGICGNRNKLLYYTVEVTQFQEKQLNLEGQLFDIIENDLKVQRLKSRKSQKHKTNTTKKKLQSEEEQERQEGNLIQKGLSNYCSSQFCYETSKNLLLKQDSPQNDYSFSPKQSKEIYSHFKYFNKTYFS